MLNRWPRKQNHLDPILEWRRQSTVNCQGYEAHIRTPVSGNCTTGQGQMCLKCHFWSSPWNHGNRKVRETSYPCSHTNKKDGFWKPQPELPGTSNSRTPGTQREGVGTGSPRTSHAWLSASPSPKGPRSLEVGWNAGNLDLARQPNTLD